MTQELQAFDFRGSKVRAILIDDDPWFVAGDVARALAYGRTQEAIRHLDADERRRWRIDTPFGGAQKVVLVSEPGLYQMVLRARTPAAKDFQRWVVHEVIPQIMRTGAYSVWLDDTESVMAAPPSLPQGLAEILRMFADQLDANVAVRSILATLVQAARAWEALANTSGDYSVGDAAKILSRDPAIETGRQRLFTTMVALDMVYVEIVGRYRDRTVYKPKQRHVDAGRLRLRMGQRWQNLETLEWNVGAPQLRITAKGLAYLHAKLGGVGTLELDALLESAVESKCLIPVN